MCGIAGIVNNLNYNLNDLKDSLIHRGPDDQHIFIDNNLALIHTRLAIQDVLHGKQPFCYENYFIIYNGEIYNHMQLRKHLNEFTFMTTSDTETLLFLYIKYKENLFSLIDGMFAFCIYDRNNSNIFIARDRSGKKPLYYYHNNNNLIFASELNAIKSIQSLSINTDAINSFLRTGFIFGNFTPYHHVHELEAGSYMTVSLDNCHIKINKYYSILENYRKQTSDLNFINAKERVEETLKESVYNRLLSSDVEVGAFLSGGIDSNLIVALATQINPTIRTFTVKFTDGYDESNLARLASQYYGTKHTEINIRFDLENDIERILLAYGQPFMDSSAIPSYYVAQEARKHVKVILNGDGADELFGGYRRYVAIANNLIHVAKLFLPFKKWIPQPHNKQSIYTYLYRLMTMSNKSGLDFYTSATNDIYEDIFTFSENSITNQMDDFISQTFNDQQLSYLSKMLYLDFKLLFFSDLLVKMDIATMAHSLEARSPFLSKEMLNLAPTLPDKFKIRRFTTKFILRELARKYLPEQLIMQPKRGFEVPLKNWVQINLKSKIYDSLQSGCYSENYIQRKFIQNLLDNTSKINEEKRAKILWGLFCLEVWYANEKGMSLCT